MTPSQLRQWSFENSQTDQWWLCLDSVTQETPCTVAEIEERLKSGNYSTVHALHSSQAGLKNAPWVEVVRTPMIKAPPVTPPLTAVTPSPPTVFPKIHEKNGLGMASFITSIVSGIFLFVVFSIAGVMESSTPGGIDEESTGAIVIGLFLFAFMGMALVALGMGIGGLVQREKKNIFAILGTVFSAVSLVVTIFLLIIGLAMR